MVMFGAVPDSNVLFWMEGSERFPRLRGSERFPRRKWYVSSVALIILIFALATERCISNNAHKNLVQAGSCMGKLARKNCDTNRSKQSNLA
jgi:hypothetical protein